MDIGFGVGNLCKAPWSLSPSVFNYHYSPLFPERGYFVKFLRNREYIEYRNVGLALPQGIVLPPDPAPAQGSH
jgi:hypothetical protein